MERMLEVWRVLLVLPAVESGRRRLGPAPLLARLRRLGARGARRDERARERLLWAIRAVDAVLPRSSCYRRALLEVTLDPVAASRELRMGIQGASGHCWLDEATRGDSLYDATFSA